MIKNYFKIAWRNFLNIKSFGLINLVGLTAGTICSLTILLFVQNQFGYEEEFTDYQDIYKVSSDNLNGSSGVSEALLISAGPPIGPTIAKDFDEVISQTRVVYMGGEYLMKPENSEKAIFQSEGYLVDSTFFDVFDIPLLEGDSKTALERPNSLILSSKIADKLFGKGNSPLDKQVQLSGNGDDLAMTVTGVYDADLGKTHLEPAYLMSMKSTGMGAYVATADEWNGNNFVHTYVKLNPNTDPAQLKAKFPAMLETYGAEQLKASNKKKILGLVPIADIHLKTTEYEFPISKNSDIKFVYMLLAIAFFIQLMACVNYINLTTAQATRRAKEIGVRKVNGAASNSLMLQFITESVMFSLLAVLLALPVIILLLPYINQLFESAFVVKDVFTLPMLVSMFALGLVTGLLSGAYPAFYLAMIDPLKVMKKAFKSGNKTFSLRNGLVVFQFAMVFLLIYAVAVISQQLNHLNDSDKGFSENQKLVIPLKTTASQTSYTTLKTQLEKMTSVNAVTASEFYPSQNIWYDQKLYKQGQTIDDGLIVQNNMARENFFETMGITLLAGRSISATDTSQMVVNEAFLRKLNIKQAEAVGMLINRQPRIDGTKLRPFEIVGVIQDYNFLSLKDEVQPVATFYDTELDNMIINYNAANPTKFLKEVEAEWAGVNPGVPFEFKFLDSEMAEVYADEQRLKKISYTFTTLAIIISLLGIWGLVSFSLERRTKEIGVRKVLGASVGELTQLLSKEFVILVGVAVLIGTPLAIYAMNVWLDGFAYRIDNTDVLLVFAGILTFGVSLITVIYKTINAAQANPIDSIKME